MDEYQVIGFRRGQEQAGRCVGDPDLAIIDELGEWDAERMRAYFESREGRRIEALHSDCQPADVITGQVDGGEPAGGVEPQPSSETRPPTTGAPERKG